MTMNLIKYALRKHFTKHEREVLEEEIDKLIDDWRNTLNEDPDSRIANGRLAALTRMKLALEDVVGEDITAKTFGITNEITTNYLRAEDITIVWKHMYIHNECIQRSIVGFYYGEPDQHSTEEFSNQPLTAEFL